MTAIVVEDEPLARSHLTRMLKAQGVQVVGEGQTGLEALNLCESVQPEVLFLDIQMPDLNGMQAAAAICQMDPQPLLVFVTGYSEHAPKAFEYSAFDYLLKPVEPARLALTLTRARKRLSERSDVRLSPVKVRELVPTQRLPVRTEYAIKLIRVEEIEYAVSREKRVFVRVGPVEQKTYYTLGQLEQLLGAQGFVRIHASALVRLSLIEELNFLGNHTYSVSLTGGAVLPVGRSYYSGLQKSLGIDS